MPILSNARHERFAQEIAKGLSQGEAYKAAGYDVDGHSAEAAGNRLLKNVEVQARIAELQGRAAEGVVLTRQWVIERLIQNVERAMQVEEVRDSKGQPTGEYRYEGSVANRALELLGKEQGMFVENTKLTVTNPMGELSNDELDRLMQELKSAGALGSVDDGAAVESEAPTSH